jgi:hypothetical protein
MYHSARIEDSLRLACSGREERIKRSFPREKVKGGGVESVKCEDASFVQYPARQRKDAHESRIRRL